VKYSHRPIINVCLPIDKPERSSNLAEFIGIILGDGGITERQVTVTLHKHDDKDFCFYVRAFFGRTVSNRERKR